MKRAILFVVALICGIVVNASAQEVATESIEARLTKTEKRTAALEKINKYVKLSGFIQGEYDWLDDREGNNSTGTSSFYIRRLRFTVAGDLYKGKAGKLDYRAYFDLARIKGSNPNPILDM